MAEVTAKVADLGMRVASKQGIDRSCIHFQRSYGRTVAAQGLHKSATLQHRYVHGYPAPEDFQRCIRFYRLQ